MKRNFAQICTSDEFKASHRWWKLEKKDWKLKLLRTTLLRLLKHCDLIITNEKENLMGGYNLAIVVSLVVLTTMKFCCCSLLFGSFYWYFCSLYLYLYFWSLYLYFYFASIIGICILQRVFVFVFLQLGPTLSRLSASSGNPEDLGREIQLQNNVARYVLFLLSMEALIKKYKKYHRRWR